MWWLRQLLLVSVGFWLLFTLLTGGAAAVGWLERQLVGRSELAYVSIQGTTTEVILFDTRRGFPFVINRLPLNSTVAGGSTGSDLYWSPDGTRLAFIEQRSQDDAIVIVNLYGQRRTIRTISGLGGRLAWSADGTRLLYSRFNNQRQWNIYAIETAELADVSLNTEPLATRGRNSYNGLWSPDGRWLAYQTGDVSDEARTLFLRDSDAPAIPMTRPPFSVTGGLAFSPDSTRLIFTGIPPNQDPQMVVPPVDLYLLNLLDAEASDVPELIPLTKSNGHNSSPVWSPDGKQIAFIQFRESGKTIYLIDAALDGGLAEPQSLTSRQFADVSSPSWSPDGRMIAFVASTGGGWLDVYTLDLLSGELHPLMQDITPERSPVWRPSHD